MQSFGDQPPIDHLLDVQEACNKGNISRSKLYNLLATKQLTAVKIGRATRIRASDLARFIDGLPTIGANREAGR